MVQASYTLFDTRMGCCAMAWGNRGIVAVQLPARSRTSTEAGILARFSDAAECAPRGASAQAVDKVTAWLAGERVDLSTIVLDYEGIPRFSRRVYALTREIAQGSTVSYGDIATRLGVPLAARAVGQALGRNPWPLIVPCHRVVAKDGKLTGFSAPGGIATKRALLAFEGVRLR